MLVFDQLNKGDRNLRIVAWAMLAGLLVLAAQLWRLQVFSADRYRATQLTQSFKTVHMPALRGKILDRHRHELVGNAPRYRLHLYLDVLQDKLNAIGGALFNAYIFQEFNSLEDEIMVQQEEQQQQLRRPGPLPRAPGSRSRFTL